MLFCIKLKKNKKEQHTVNYDFCCTFIMLLRAQTKGGRGREGGKEEEMGGKKRAGWEVSHPSRFHGQAGKKNMEKLKRKQTQLCINKEKWDATARRHRTSSYCSGWVLVDPFSPFRRVRRSAVDSGIWAFSFQFSKRKRGGNVELFCFSRFCFSSSQPVIVADVGWCCVRKYIGHSRQAQSQAPPSYVVVVATEGRPLGPSRYSCISVGRQHNATKVPISAYWWAQFCFQAVFFQKRKRKIEKGKLFTSFPLFQIALNLHLTLFPTVTGQRNDRYIKCAIEGFCEVRP